MNTYDDIFLQAMDKDESVVVRNNEVQKGRVISQHDKGFFVTLGGKSEAILPMSEIIRDIAIGDEVEVVFHSLKDGISEVSQKKASRVKVLENLYRSSEENIPVTAKITKIWTNRDANELGYIVNINGVEAYLPFSHIKKPNNVQELIGQEINVVVINFDKDRVVVSERILREKLQRENFAQFVDNHNIGDTVSVKVTSIDDSYVLVSDSLITMFLHITEFDWKFVKSLKDVIKIGDQFDVIIKEIDTAKKSIKVSRKAAIENPVDVFFDTQKINNNIYAKVIRFVKGLVILESDAGVAMVLPVSEMSWVNKVSDPKHLLSIGDRVEVKIKEIDEVKKRISVSLRDLLENPWAKAIEVFPINSKKNGLISSVTDFGIFVMFENGIQGLVRKEDVDWTDQNINLADKFKKGDSISVIVLNVDPSKEKLRLGIKQLSENPFKNFVENYNVGSVVSGTIKEILKDGIELELEKGVEAFIHISQLATERLEKIESLFSVGDTVQAAIRRINIPQQKIEMSIKELTRAEEQKEINQVLSSYTQETPTLGAIFGDLLKKK